MDADYLPLYVLGSIVTFFLAVVITRAIFSIPAIVKYHKAQMILLALMAQKAGVDEDQIKEAVNQADQVITFRKIDQPSSKT